LSGDGNVGGKRMISQILKFNEIGSGGEIKGIIPICIRGGSPAGALNKNITVSQRSAGCTIRYVTADGLAAHPLKKNNPQDTVNYTVE